MECERCQGGGQIVKYLGCDDGCYEFEPCPDCDGKGETMSNYTCECPAVFGGDDAQRDRDIHMGSCGFVKIRKERDLLLLQNSEMLAVLIALADRVSVRFGETIKYEPVATGRYLDAAYEVIGKAKTEKPKDECTCNWTPHLYDCPVVQKRKCVAVQPPIAGISGECGLPDGHPGDHQNSRAVWNRE